QARRGRDRHPHAADEHRRRAARRADAPRRAARHGRPRPVAVRRGGLRDRPALGGGAGVGYLLKDRVGEVRLFTDAVERVAAGGSALDPEVVSHMLQRKRSEDPLDELTPREREVLELMAEGRSNKAIAEQLVVTERAIEKHVTSIFGKLRLPASAEDHRRVLAVLAYLRA